MSDKNAKVIAVIFLLIIFIFGAGTLLKCEDTFRTIIKENKFFSCKTEVEQSIQEQFKSRNNWINLNGVFQRLIGSTIIRDAGDTDVYKLKNGQIMSTLARQNMDSYSKKLKSFYEECTKLDVDFLYVQLPFKIENDNVMPVGTSEYGNENADELLKYLRKYEVPTLDIRDKIREMGYQYEDLFFNTDHHWKPRTALWAAGVIAKDMSNRYNYNIELEHYNIQHYDVKTYENWFLGSLGKRTGVWYAGVDDFDLITPDFDTNFDFYAECANGDTVVREGAFDKAMFAYQNIEKKDYFNLNTYAGYIGGDYPLNQIKNNMAVNDKKVLLIRDSFSCAMQPYLALSVGEIDAIDLRHYQGMSLKEYIVKHDIDLVIVAYNPSAFGEQQFWF